MTDKQIIIDGVDCRYWFRPNPTDYRKCSLRGQDDNCDEIKDCFVKELLGKLARKEQECEFSNLRIIQLQETLSQYETDLSTKDCIVETCKAQYKELKAENDNIKETFDGLFKVQYKLADNNKKLRQCLTEIKVLSENVYCLTNALNRDMALFAKEIIQKISECEGNDA